MSRLYDEFIESQNDSSVEAAGVGKATINQEVVPPEQPYIEPNIVTIVSPQAKSAFGSVAAGLLLGTAIAVGGYAYLSNVDNNRDSVERENQAEDSNIVTEPVDDIYGLSKDTTSVGVMQSSGMTSSGCERQLSSVDGVPGAYTRTGSNTDLCWRIGEVVASSTGSAGVVTFWGESPYAGKLDDHLIREKLQSQDITTEELHAFFRTFVIDNVTDSEFILVDRSGENYQWPIDNKIENVIVSIKESQG